MIKLGVIGLSEGNGHPYSWSAITNGYNQKYMDECPFPVIPRYLQTKQFPKDTIKNAVVTHIWTQETKFSTHIANAANIPYICNSIKEMIQEVDAVLLARDDYQNHYMFSKPIIESGLPIYIDKPLAIDQDKATEILSLRHYEGQIFSCSGLKYSPDFMITEEDQNNLGQIYFIQASVMKSWEKYAVHVIDIILELFGFNFKIESAHITKSNHINNVVYKTNKDIVLDITSLQNTANVPICFNIFGEKGTKKLEIQDTFNAFKQTLNKFISQITTGQTELSIDEMMKSVELIERGIIDDN